MISREVKQAETGYLILLDEEDQDIIVKSWFVSYKDNRQNYYSIRRKFRKEELLEGKKKSIKLHNEVWEKHFGPVPLGFEIDHIDYNTCNNQKQNLRLLTKKANNERVRKKHLKEMKNGESMAEAT